jgi:hypothetical protein
MLLIPDRCGFLFDLFGAGFCCTHIQKLPIWHLSGAAGYLDREFPIGFSIECQDSALRTGRANSFQILIFTPHTIIFPSLLTSAVEIISSSIYSHSSEFAYDLKAFFRKLTFLFVAINLLSTSHKCKVHNGLFCVFVLLVNVSLLVKHHFSLHKSAVRRIG